jgi:hypothetical protein
VELGDAWVPFSLSAEQMGEWIGRAQDTEAWAARTEPLEIVLRSPDSLDALRRPDHTRQVLADARAAGATNFMARFDPHSLEDYLEQLAAFAELARESE